MDDTAAIAVPTGWTLPRWRSLPAVGAVLAGLAVLMVTASLHSLAERNHVVASRAHVLEQISTAAGRLQEVLNARAGLAHGLSAIVRANDGRVDLEQFRIFAEHLRADQRDIRSLQLAPRAVVRFVYPLKGNEAAVGHDIRQDPIRSPAVERAIRERRFVVAGPFELIQGGVALIARLPIYLPDSFGGDTFWGFATVVLDLAPLLEAGGIVAAEQQLDVAMRGSDGLGAAGELFYGRPEVLAADPVFAEIALPNGTWQVAAAPRGGWAGHPYTDLIWAGGAGMMIVTALLIYHLLAMPQRLQSAVDTATGALRRSRREAEELTVQARRAEQEKTRFLAAASHDLKQPLAALRLFVGLLADEPLPPQCRAWVERMETTLHGALELLDSLLHTSALDTGKVAPQVAAVSVRQLMAQVLPAHQQEAAAKGLLLSMDHCVRRECRSRACSDPILLKRILGNLLSNAVRYTESGRIRIRCHCRDDRTLIFVGDTGPGIPADRLPRIFDEFYRGSRDACGAGLGLNIVSKLAAAMGHRVVVRSRVGAGTVFMIVVPHCRSAAAAGERGVLLVEDDEDQLFALQAVLEAMGFSVTPATSVDEALDQLRCLEAPPDLVVTDHWLSGTRTGADLARHMAAHGAVPTLIHTSDVDAAGRDLPPTCRVIAKGVSPQAFRAAVAATLGVAEPQPAA